ncbi:MARVEL domain-containing protein 2 [Merluccius polli]|uniref:MARVEL domain-containing protein 2 n=1 Tax=Merluccius polli TaxID=89951 RepID=A0AA47NZA8_MERPO|nr:MARVEL domain-containing protein 2 [Merluccius polli]
MYSGANGFGTRVDHVREIPYYDEVPMGSLWRDQDPMPPLHALRGADLCVSSDPLPPPPLPDVPAVGGDPYAAPSSVGDPLDPDSSAMDIKPVHRFVPDSVKNFFRSSGRSVTKGWSFPPAPQEPDSPAPSWQKDSNHTTSGVRCSPPHSPPPSPSLPGSYVDRYGGSGGSYTSRKERDGLLLGAEALGSEAHTNSSAMTYSERVENYHLRYAYMKSWAGLLRILGCIELLLGAAVFACVCAYVHKDNEWFNMFGYSKPQLYGGLGGGAMAGAYGQGGVQYTGPKTPFVLVVAGLAWIVTVILLVLGMTLYYRAILLDSSWWPLTECIINLALALLYLAAGVVYVRDITRGGLCNHPVFNNGVNGGFCRTESGQTAAMVFLFLTMILYFIGAGVCLKLWRHEASRLRKAALDQEVSKGSVGTGMHSHMETVASSLPLSLLNGGPRSEPTPLPTFLPEDAYDHTSSHGALRMPMEPEILQGHIPAGHIPKPVIIADYVAKYPAIQSEEQRDQYKAVFNDQYAEYKELHVEVQAMAKRFEEMDELMSNLPSRPSSQMDPTFLEKRDRCEYLKNKLSHIKLKIQEYNKVHDWNDGLSSSAKSIHT